MRRAVGFLLQPEPSAIESIVLGVIGVLIFRLGFYRDHEWLCVIGGITIFIATVAFVINISRLIIFHLDVPQVSNRDATGLIPGIVLFAGAKKSFVTAPVETPLRYIGAKIVVIPNDSMEVKPLPPNILDFGKILGPYRVRIAVSGYPLLGWIEGNGPWISRGIDKVIRYWGRSDLQLHSATIDYRWKFSKIFILPISRYFDVADDLLQCRRTDIESWNSNSSALIQLKSLLALFQSGISRRCGTLGGIGGFLVNTVGFNHRIQLIGVNPSNANRDDEDKYLEDELPEGKTFPPWRRLGVVIGIILFGWGRWTLGYGRSDIAERTAVLALVAMLGGAILALWSV